MSFPPGLEALLLPGTHKGPQCTEGQPKAPLPCLRASSNLTPIPPLPLFPSFCLLHADLSQASGDARLPTIQQGRVGTPLTNYNPRQNTSSHERSGKGVGLSGETSREGWTGEGEFKLGSRRR